MENTLEPPKVDYPKNTGVPEWMKLTADVSAPNKEDLDNSRVLMIRHATT